ncbi:MAG: porin [Pseudomonadota bacterium]
MRASTICGASLAVLAFAQPAAGQSISAEEAAALRAEVARLKAQLQSLESRLGALEPAPVVTAPPAAGPAPATVTAKSPTSIEWRGSPQFRSQGRSFKAKGRIQADLGVVSRPDGLSDRGLGTATEFRRLRLGGEGSLGDGVGYKLEFELSDNGVDTVDTFVTYERGRFLLMAGNQNPFQSLDELTGDTSGSLMERAAYTDAFNFERRLGVSLQYRGPVLIQGGIFADDISSLSNDADGPAGGDENNSYSLDGRLVWAPKLGDAQLHTGVSAHMRKLKRVGETPVRYRQRPYLHTSNTRLIGTPALEVDRETSFGVEGAAIRGPWHAVAEAHWLEARRPDAPDAGFWGAYAEVGYFLTEGDSRSYKDGIFGRTEPARPLGDGGIGAVQINLRYDYLDLNDGLIRGGTQDAWLAAVIWTPIDYLRLNLNYGYLRYDGAAVAANGRRDYGVHVGGARFELDF